MRIIIIIQAIVTAVACTIATAAPAQEWPTRAVTMVVPFAAGGGGDLAGRILAPRMSELLGRTVVVENIGGAGGMNGAARVANAQPDGYQFVLGNIGTHAQNQTLYKNPLYNAATDFTLVGEIPMLLVARKDMPAANLREFIAYAKANQQKMHTAPPAPARTRISPARCSMPRSG
jgi:tripartite-type tricarboxylate transporter receptor subunit TctC